jgi:hypothetical protein
MKELLDGLGEEQVEVEEDSTLKDLHTLVKAKYSGVSGFKPLFESSMIAVDDEYVM